MRIKIKETIQKFRPIITISDGSTYEGEETDWVLVDRLRCSAPEYLMSNIKQDGYVKYTDNKFYMLPAIISIEWVKAGEKEIGFDGNKYTSLISDEDVKYYEQNLI